MRVQGSVPLRLEFQAQHVDRSGKARQMPVDAVTQGAIRARKMEEVGMRLNENGGLFLNLHGFICCLL